jgi:acetyl esterase
VTEKDLKDLLVSPVYASLKGLPRTLILTDEHDPTLDQAQRYARKLRKAGVPTKVIYYHKMIHGFFLMAGQLDAGRQSINQISSALKAVFKQAG